MAAKSPVRASEEQAAARQGLANSRERGEADRARAVLLTLAGWTSVRIMGRAHEQRFVNANRILNRAAWCPRTGGRILLGLLVDAFARRGPVILGLDDTIERRRGKRIAAKGSYRDPVRSSDSHFVKASGLRSMSLMVLAPIPWAGRIWALPFLTALVPSGRACRERGRRHKSLLDVGRQLALQARRWLPDRDLVLVGDGGFSALLFLDAMRRGRITAIARTTPCLLAMFSIVALLAARLPPRQRRRVAAAAW